MDIEKISKVYPDILYAYFNHLSSLAIVLIDKNKRIIDCNDGFIKILGLNKKPINESLDEFLFRSPDEILLSEKSFDSIDLIFKGSDNIEILLKGSIFPIDNSLYLMLLEQHRITYNELIIKMAELNSQIVNITRELERKNTQLEDAVNKIERIMKTDPLTGVLNRRALQKSLNREISFAKRHNLPLSVVMIDIDHFKRVNDTYGHKVGDSILKSIAKIISKSIRQEDIQARFGGEEFILILPNTNTKSAFHACNRIRQKIEMTKFRGVKERITASFGITGLLQTDDSTDILRRADMALYEAKQKGRNRCEIKIDN